MFYYNLLEILNLLWIIRINNVYIPTVTPEQANLYLIIYSSWRIMFSLKLFYVYQLRQSNNAWNTSEINMTNSCHTLDNTQRNAFTFALKHQSYVLYCWKSSLNHCSSANAIGPVAITLNTKWEKPLLLILLFNYYSCLVCCQGRRCTFVAGPYSTMNSSCSIGNIESCCAWFECFTHSQLKYGKSLNFHWTLRLEYLHISSFYIYLIQKLSKLEQLSFCFQLCSLYFERSSSGLFTYEIVFCKTNN